MSMVAYLFVDVGLMAAGVMQSEADMELYKAGAFGALAVIETTNILKDLYVLVMSRKILVLYLVGGRLIVSSISSAVIVPELLIVRFLQCLTHQIRTDLLQALSGGCPTCESCARLDRHYRNCQAVYRALGKSLMVIVTFSSVQLVFSSYYFCLYFMGKVETQSAVEVWSNIACWSISCAMGLMRLAHLADYSHRLSDAFAEAAEALIRLEAHPDECTPKVLYIS